MARPRSPEKKEWIRKAAINLISEEGFHGVTTDKIAREAGVSVGTIYNYFENKEDIISYIFQVEHKKLDILFDRFRMKKISVPEKFKLLIEKYFKYVYNNKKVAKIIHNESFRPGKKITREIINYILAIRQNLKELIDEGVREGSVYPDYNLDMVVNIIMGLSFTTVVFGYMEPDEVEYIYKKGPEDIYNMLARGIFKKV
ncbi:MAG: TetR/AcrR family transcriptional regulator [Halanaerobiales bacterium]